jgi:hypothetical protein
MATVHAAEFWIMRNFSAGLRAARPLVIEAAPSRTVRKLGAAVINALWTDAATAPIGWTALVRALENSYVAATKLRNAVFQPKKSKVAFRISRG